MAANDQPTVMIAGAGIAGLAASILLAKGGLDVVCIDPKAPPRVRVGESLDWSAPALLAALGIRSDNLVARGIGTNKREVRAVTPSGERMIGRPWPWLYWWPLRFESTTLHVDRRQFDQVLFDEAAAAGVKFIWDHVQEVEFEGDRIVACRTRSGQQLQSDWFVDATGRRRLIGRSLGIPCDESGQPRMALWCETTAPMTFDGTMLYLDDTSEHLAWAWEIPIATDRQSVGAVITHNGFQALKRSGFSPQEILREELARFSRFRSTPPDALGRVRTRSYRPFVSGRVTGINWLMVGEAAAFVDPLTSNGVTAALRHAREGAAVIIDHKTSPEQTGQRLRSFEKRVRDLAALYNLGIEMLMYQPQLRRALGIRWASRAYVPLGFFTNALYSRLEPTTAWRAATIALLFHGFRAWTRAWLVFACGIGTAHPTGGKRGQALRGSGLGGT